MTSIRSLVARMFQGAKTEATGAPEADFVLAPRDADETARLLDTASEHRLTVLPWGGGTHQGLGGRIDPDIVLVTSGLGGITDFQPDDLTVVVGGGHPAGDLEETLADSGVTAVLPESSGPGTVGGSVASAASPWRRLRYGPVRDRMLEVTLATGDGRLVRAGGRVVKNVTGYDLPRLCTGSLGSLGVITEVCLKLWPLGASQATVTLDDPLVALSVARRPLAVLAAADGVRVYLSGTPQEVEAQADSLGGSAVEGLVWPDEPAGEAGGTVRVPPSLIAEAVERLPRGVGYLAAFGVGELWWAGTADEARHLTAEVRPWAEDAGGSAVLTSGPANLYSEFDPWGSPPPTVDLQRRVKAAFDPLGVMVPGRLPGGV